MHPTTALSIQKPCVESWTGMQPAESGRRCLSCEKMVVDFTTYSNAELKTWFAQPRTGPVCGRFRDDQLNRALRNPQPTSQSRAGLLSGFLALLLGWQTARGQSGPPAGKLTPTPPLSIPVARQGIALPSFSPTQHVHPSGDKFVAFVAKGRVTDEKGELLPGVTLIVRGSKRGTSTDALGNFSLTVYDDDRAKGGYLTVDVQYIGYEAKVIQLATVEQPPILITLNEGQQLMGEVIVVRQSMPLSPIRRVLAPIKRLFIRH